MRCPALASARGVGILIHASVADRCDGLRPGRWSDKPLSGEITIGTEDNDTTDAKRQSRIKNAVLTVEDLLSRNEWEAAAAAAANIRRLFPEDPDVVELVARVKREREPYRRHLKRQFLDAARGDDPELAMELLKELDKFLTRAEAAPMLEVAQEVIERMKQCLGQRFKAAINNSDWNAAVLVGDQIVRDFENTRMAEEARNMLELLRERAMEQQSSTQ